MRLSILLLAALMVYLPLAGCGGGKTSETGSLNRTYQLIDDQGRVSGTLTLDPMGGAQLLDVDGKVIGSFTSTGTIAQPASADKEKMKEEDMKDEETSKQ